MLGFSSSSLGDVKSPWVTVLGIKKRMSEMCVRIFVRSRAAFRIHWYVRGWFFWGTKNKQALCAFFSWIYSVFNRTCMSNREILKCHRCWNTGDENSPYTINSLNRNCNDNLAKWKETLRIIYFTECEIHYILIHINTKIYSNYDFNWYATAVS